MLVQGLMHVDDDVEEEFEIDINDEEPEFLKGQSAKSGVEVSPVKIVANPDGSLQVRPRPLPLFTAPYLPLPPHNFMIAVLPPRFKIHGMTASTVQGSSRVSVMLS